MQFNSLGLSSPLLKAVSDQSYQEATPIQARIIPEILKGKDVMAAAQTGTGKTAGFTLPLLDLLTPGQQPKQKEIRALILTPTRELAAQVAASVTKYGKYLSLSSLVVFGGVSINPQIKKLQNGVDILIATPGRLLDLYQQGTIQFQRVEILVLDEADRMLDMGFIHDMRKIVALLPKKKQTLMFSATFSDSIKTLAQKFLDHPVEVSIAPEVKTAKAIKQWLCPVDKKQKPALLAHLVHENKWNQVLVFSRTKHGANKLVKFLEQEKLTAMAIHGNKTQSARTKALEAFKSNKIQILVATDIAARGLDIQLLPAVINVDLPQVAEDYVHRIGRTGRASASGEAISLVSADEIDLLFSIEKLIKNKLLRVYVDSFHPEHDLPESRSNITKPKKTDQDKSDYNKHQQRKKIHKKRYSKRT